ncbi:MAG: isocitrate lyase [Candidatus Krumholzibacteriota bacterium]|nr:isocitrate lyase [Candidatus Krumholzibacteriota bacterium]
MTASRWRGITRPYDPADVYRLRGSFQIEYTLARMGAERLWQLLNNEPYVHALSAVTGNQAIQHIRAGLKAIYVSGWQAAADGNNAHAVYPDLSLYPCDSVPLHVRRLNNALLRADQIHHLGERNGVHWLAPIIADAEAGFGGNLHAFELMRAMIREGAAGVHFEDQLSSVKKCGHLGGKVLVPTSEFITKLVAARLAADVCSVDTLLVARTDAGSAGLITSDADPVDHRFITGERSHEGFFRVRCGLDQAIARGISYAPYADLLWFETSRPDVGEAREFATEIHEQFPGKMLAYNCSPSFNWKANLDDRAIGRFQEELGELGYRFQFVTLSGFHSLNLAMFKLASGYRDRGMSAYSELQEEEFALEASGYEAVRHQEFAGTGYFDAVNEVASGGLSSTASMSGSTEEQQF